MTKKISLKLIAALFAVLLIITTALTISVSHAKWVANDNATVSGSADVGVWIACKYKNEIFINGEHQSVTWDVGYDGNLWNKAVFEVQDVEKEILIVAFRGGEIVEDFSNITLADGVTRNGNLFTFKNAGSYVVVFKLSQNGLTNELSIENV